MAIYSKGQKGYAEPYSADDPDFKPAGDNLASYPVRGKPTQPGGGYGPPDGNSHDYNAIDCSRTIDTIPADAQGFDDGKGKGGWLRTKSRDQDGFSGDLLPGGRANNHPIRTSKNAR